MTRLAPRGLIGPSSTTVEAIGGLYSRALDVLSTIRGQTEDHVRRSPRYPMKRKEKPTASAAKQVVLTDEHNRPLVSGERLSSGVLTLKITPLARRQKAATLNAVSTLLDQLG